MSKETKLHDLVEKVQSYFPAADVDLIRKAHDFSAKVHTGQKRLSGEPYLIHPIAVADVIADLKLDVPVAVLTSSPEEIDRKRARELGADCYLLKPPTTAMVLSCCRQFELDCPQQ